MFAVYLPKWKFGFSEKKRYIFLGRLYAHSPSKFISVAIKQICTFLRALPKMVSFKVLTYSGKNSLFQIYICKLRKANNQSLLSIAFEVHSNEQYDHYKV